MVQKFQRSDWSNGVQLIINFNPLLGKNKLCGPEKFQCYTALVALFEIRFRSLFLDVGKEDNEVTTIP